MKTNFIFIMVVIFATIILDTLYIDNIFNAEVSNYIIYSTLLLLGIVNGYWITYIIKQIKKLLN